MPAKSVKELIAFAKKRPGEINVATSGALNWTQVFCALGNTGKGAFDPGDPPKLWIRR